MTRFQSTAEVENHFLPFFQDLMADPVLGPKFASLDVAFRVDYTEPEASFRFDTTVDPPVVTSGDQARTQDSTVVLSMTSDSGHKFWLGDLNLVMALGLKKVKATGDVNRLLRLLPAMKPSYAKYREYALNAA